MASDDDKDNPKEPKEVGLTVLPLGSAAFADSLAKVQKSFVEGDIPDAYDRSLLMTTDVGPNQKDVMIMQARIKAAGDIHRARIEARASEKIKVKEAEATKEAAIQIATQNTSAVRAQAKYGTATTRIVEREKSLRHDRQVTLAWHSLLVRTATWAVAVVAAVIALCVAMSMGLSEWILRALLSLLAALLLGGGSVAVLRKWQQLKAKSKAEELSEHEESEER